MIENTYDYTISEDKLQYAFLSEGKQGTIPKVILFTHRRKNEWNLGFGDLQNGVINDSIISNNHDAMKIIRTVARTTLEFFEDHLDATIIINPIDEKRKRFYNFIFEHYFAEIDDYFHIIGIINKKKETYSSKKIYDSFKISYKFVQ